MKLKTKIKSRRKLRSLSKSIFNFACVEGEFEPVSKCLINGSSDSTTNSGASKARRQLKYYNMAPAYSYAVFGAP
ncbi:MAG: hypothetical protein HRT88_01620 [Lentisphaeraceae bacterium]|nr:hypothetical protein [Lentisphaeraceae bacterium]